VPQQGFEELRAGGTLHTAVILERRGFAEIEAPDLSALGRGLPISTHAARLPAAIVAYTHRRQTLDASSYGEPSPELCLAPMLLRWRMARHSGVQRGTARYTVRYREIQIDTVKCVRCRDAVRDARDTTRYRRDIPNIHSRGTRWYEAHVGPLLLFTPLTPLIHTCCVAGENPTSGHTSHLHLLRPGVGGGTQRHLRALLSVCGGCSFGGVGCYSCRVCVSVSGVLFSVGVCVCACVCVTC